VADHCLRSLNCVNVIVAGKQPQHDWLTMDEALDHCTRGLGISPFASNDQGSVPDVVMACCGDVPTLETLAAVQLLRRHLPELKVRVVNVVDLVLAMEEGTTTTLFDMVMLNDLDRFRLVIDVLDRVPGLNARTATLRQEMVDARLDARRYGREHGEDPREIAQWRWDAAAHSR